MDLILRIAFDSDIRSEIEIANPSYVPDFGDMVDFKYEDFMTDTKDIKNAQEFEENHSWYVGLKSVTYKKDHAEVLIVLEEENNFKENHPQYFAIYCH